jgi:putative heme-binding domain-containing protein
MLFLGSAQCSTCHMAAGRGGFIALDLSAYGQTHTAEEINAAITNPAKRDSAKNMVDVLTATGEHYEGMIRNEDNFSLQLQTIDGTFHFFSKKDLKAIERSRESIMPSDYATRLTKSEIEDLVSYLLSIGRTSAPADKHHDDDE